MFFSNISRKTEFQKKKVLEKTYLRTPPISFCNSGTSWNYRYIVYMQAYIVLSTDIMYISVSLHVTYLYKYCTCLNTPSQKKIHHRCLACREARRLSRTPHSELRRCGSRICPVGRDSTGSLLTGFVGSAATIPGTFRSAENQWQNMAQNQSDRRNINTVFQSGPKLESDPC